jgi:hypothetical protein
VQIFTWILSGQGELDEIRWDKHFDMKIILICPADLERWRSNRIYCFLWFGFRDGVDFVWFERVLEGGKGRFLISISYTVFIRIFASSAFHLFHNSQRFTLHFTSSQH